MNYLQQLTYAEMLTSWDKYQSGRDSRPEYLQKSPPVFEDEEEYHMHVYAMKGSDGRFHYLHCKNCGHEHQIVNPEYLSWYTRQKIKDLAESGKPKERERFIPDRVDRQHMKQSIDKYEGDDLRKDLLQPYNPDGSLNYEYVKEYGPPPENVKPSTV